MNHVLHIGNNSPFCGETNVPTTDLATHFRVPNPRMYVTGNQSTEHPFTEWCEECLKHPDLALALLGNV